METKTPRLIQRVALIGAMTCLSVIGLRAQSCDCLSDFDFVIQVMEQEHPGFDLNVTGQGLEAYQQRIAEVKASIADSVQGPEGCARQTGRYLDFFLDNHLSISVPSEEAQEA